MRISIVVLGGLAAVLFASRPARAYCREVVADTPPAYDPAEAGACFLGSPIDAGARPPFLYWSNQCVSYSLQRSASASISLADAERVAEKAFGAWSNAACPGGGTPSITAVSYPPVDCPLFFQGHHNLIEFRDDGWDVGGANPLGYTVLNVVLSTGEIVEADTEINSSDYVIVPDPPAPPGAYDLQSILTHEAGHFLGLAHSADTNAVMYAFYHPGSISLTDDDVEGICAIYDPDGMRKTSGGDVASRTCDATPPGGFSTQCAPDLDAGPPLVDAGADGAAGPPCDTSVFGLLGCRVAPGLARPGRSRRGDAGAVALGLVLIGALARRRARARDGGVSGRVPPALLGLLVAAAIVLARHDAAASVAVVASFADLVDEATAVAVVTPLERRASWEGRRIATYTHLRVDRLVAGRVDGDLWVRTLGGAIGDLGQIVEGEATFPPGVASLVFVRPYLDSATRRPTGAFVVAQRAQGQFPIVPADHPGGVPRVLVAPNVGGLVPPARPARAPTARDVLNERPLEEAVGIIVDEWSASMRHSMP